MLRNTRNFFCSFSHVLLILLYHTGRHLLLLESVFLARKWFVLIVGGLFLYPFLFGCSFVSLGSIFALVSLREGRCALRTLITFYYSKISSGQEMGLLSVAKPIVQPNGGLCREGNTNPWLGQSEGKLTCLIPFGGAALSLSSPLEVRDLEVALKQMKLCPCYNRNFYVYILLCVI